MYSSLVLKLFKGAARLSFVPKRFSFTVGTQLFQNFLQEPHVFIMTCTLASRNLNSSWPCMNSGNCSSENSLITVMSLQIVLSRYQSTCVKNVLSPKTSAIPIQVAENHPFWNSALTILVLLVPWLQTRAFSDRQGCLVLSGLILILCCSLEVTSNTLKEKITHISGAISQHNSLLLPITLSSSNSSSSAPRDFSCCSQDHSFCNIVQKIPSLIVCSIVK